MIFAVELERLTCKKRKQNILAISHDIILTNTIKNRFIPNTISYVCSVIELSTVSHISCQSNYTSELYRMYVVINDNP